jgi:aspartokinase
MTIIENKIEETFSLKAVTISRENDTQVLSFVGSQIEEKFQLKESLLQKLNIAKNNFSFKNITSVSISFTVNDLDSQEALKMGHQVLKEF